MRPQQLNFLFQEMSVLSGIGPKIFKRMAALCGGGRVLNAVYHLPVSERYRPLQTDFNDFISGSYATFLMTATEHQCPPVRRRPYRIFGTCGVYPVELIFFNYHTDFLQSKLKEGAQVYISGKVEYTVLGGVKVLHPDYMASNSCDIPVVEPIYPLAAGISNKMVHHMTGQIIPSLPELPEWLDAAFQKQEGFLSWRRSLGILHTPVSVSETQMFETCHRRLAYDELLAHQLSLRLIRGKRRMHPGVMIQAGGVLMNQIVSGLPFQLTNAQQRVIDEIKADMASGQQMVRLLQGDVGAGKTVVAVGALVEAVESGFQGAFMAPTDILARQHFETLTRLMSGMPISVCLLTGRDKGKSRQEILTHLASGEAQIVVGTHALFTEDVFFKRLGLVVIDEQHKFGVHQRLTLAQKQKGVHILSMTATPIPRTLALTSYGDMDFSKLDEKPAGRQAVDTRVMPCAKVNQIAHKLKEMIVQSGSRTQAYWVCPLVEESEKTDLMAAEKRFKMLQEVFGSRIGLVHGQMKATDKDQVMQRFIQGDIDVLVATTVIEVGVDVKAASIMVIEHAERFGLAGLHQLRGRIGRGNQASVCLLLYGNPLSDTAQKRLRVMRETDDGFIIAEEDLKLRGAGEILGAKQSGMPDYAVADLSKDTDLLYSASKDAGLIFNTDPNLTSPRGQALKTLLYVFEQDKDIHNLTAG